MNGHSLAARFFSPINIVSTWVSWTLLISALTGGLFMTEALGDDGVEDDEGYHDTSHFLCGKSEEEALVEKDPSLDILMPDFWPPHMPEAVKLGSPEQRLLWGAGSGWTQFVMQALENGANVHAVNHLGQTAMQIAMANADDNVILLLIEHGADLTTSLEGLPLFHWAASKGKIHIMDWLLRRDITVNDIDAEGNTALHTLAEMPWTETNRRVVRWLLQQDALCNIRNHQGQTAREVALALGNQAMANLLADGENLQANQNSSNHYMIISPQGILAVPEWVVTYISLGLQSLP